MSRPSKWRSKTVAIRVPADLADALVHAIALCEYAGIDPKLLLLRLKLKSVLDFLSHYSEQQRKEFVARMVKEVFENEEKQADQPQKAG